MSAMEFTVTMSKASQQWQSWLWPWHLLQFFPSLLMCYRCGCGCDLVVCDQDNYVDPTRVCCCVIITTVTEWDTLTLTSTYFFSFASLSCVVGTWSCYKHGQGIFFLSWPAICLSLSTTIIWLSLASPTQFFWKMLTCSSKHCIRLHNVMQ